MILDYLAPWTDRRIDAHTPHVTSQTGALAVFAALHGESLDDLESITYLGGVDSKPELEFVAFRVNASGLRYLDAVGRVATRTVRVPLVGDMPSWWQPTDQCGGNVRGGPGCSCDPLF